MKKTKVLIIFTLLFLFSFGLASAESVSFTNPIGYNTASDFASNLLTNIRNLVVVLSLIFIVIGAIMYMVSAGNEKAITKAKATITAALIGFAISLSAETFLKEIWTITGATVSSPSSSRSFSDIANSALELLLSLVGVLGIIGMVLGGVMYLTAYGDDKKVETGKKILTYSIIGVVIALASVILLKQIDSVISGS